MERRMTVQKELVLDAVRSLGNHANADEIFNEVTRSHPSVSRGTVYRNLNILAEEGTILRVEVPGGADRFDHNIFAHYHILCVKCGKVYDVDMDEVHDIFGKIKDRHGFDFIGYEIGFKGICPCCKGKTIPEKERDNENN